MLKRLELNGFKSFAKKSELEFGSSVTAIVGPNGSGKSNVVEAFRFVLGEQSLKSMRGKSGSDLIFKGSKTISPLNRAKVSVVFDNSTRRFAFASSDSESSLNVDFEEIEITREVFRDGVNKYLINGTEVRLKDIHELLSSVNIGSSGHHIISQGQADRLLTATPKERRSMVEDALGLKAYQIKIKDAEKKIEKTEQNMKEVESLRREIAPHIRYLKKQVDKMKEAENLRHELGGLYKTYLAKQDHVLKNEYDDLIEHQRGVSEILARYDDDLSRLGAGREFALPHSITERQNSIREKRHALLQSKEDLSRQIGRVEAMIEMNEVQETKPQEQSIIIHKQEFEAFVRDLTVFSAEGISATDVVTARALLQKIQDIVFAIKSRYGETQTHPQQYQKNTHALGELTEKLTELKQSMEQILSAVLALEHEEREITESIEKLRSDFYHEQQERFEIEKKRAGALGEHTLIQEKITRVRERRKLFEEEIQEGIVLVGKEILSYGSVSVVGGEQASVEEMRRSIERLKIKLEEAGALGGDEVLQEYQDVSTRDQFLEKELIDLSSSLASLRTLIEDLKQTLDVEFKQGIGKITHAFHEFFTTMFGGGSAELRVIEIKQRKKIKDEGEDEDGDGAGIEEEGVSIEVSLPHKKVRELTMLSGGERSLTSIALLFAMSQVNPPPFLVLDETDAALDEANSRRYGDMIQKLSEYAELIVVTHNRETMSRAETLYGVTVGADGASKLLSIKLSDAAQYAK